MSIRTGYDADIAIENAQQSENLKQMRRGLGPILALLLWAAVIPADAQDGVVNLLCQGTLTKYLDGRPEVEPTKVDLRFNQSQG